MLESLAHRDSTFITLTYEKEPENGSLVPSDFTAFIKSLRKMVAPQKIRYFMAGEYGDQTNRPHYHAIIFGLSPIVAGGYRGGDGLVQKAWGLGHTFAGALTDKSAGYVAGYVTKKLTDKDDVRLHGRHPEYARMSLRPGIGFNAVEVISRAIVSDHVLDSIAESGQLPTALRHGSKILPIGRYLREKVRQSVGFSKEALQESVGRQAAQEVSRVLAEDAIIAEVEKVSRDKLRLDRHLQKILNCERKYAIHKGSRKL